MFSGQTTPGCSSENSLCINRSVVVIYIVLGPALRSFGPISSLEATSTLLCFAVSWGVRGPGRVGSGLGRVKIGSRRGRVGSRTVGSVGLRLLLLGPIQDGGNGEGGFYLVVRIPPFAHHMASIFWAN